MLDAQLPPVSCVAKDHQPVAGPQGTAHEQDIGKVVFIQNAF